MLRTIELILGLAPLSPVRRRGPADVRLVHRQARPDTLHPEPARIDLNAVNAPTAYGAERSLKMDFDEYDRIDDFELNEILWRAIKGKDAPVPPRRPSGDRHSGRISRDKGKDIPCTAPSRNS